MSEKPVATVFTKPNCSFCEKAKEILAAADVTIREVDVSVDRHAAGVSAFVSGSHAAPQIFIGATHIAGAVELEKLRDAGVLNRIIAAERGRSLDMDGFDASLTSQALEDLSLHEILPKHDPTREYDEKNLFILSFYRQMFGFLPIAWRYVAVWPEAYRTLPLCQVISSFPAVAVTIGPGVATAVAHETARVHGCAMCTIHSAVNGGDRQVQAMKSLYDLQKTGEAVNDHFGAFETAMVRLGRHATLNTVTEEMRRDVRDNAASAKDAPRDGEAAIDGAAMMVAAMGFFNVLNDLINVEIEGGLADTALTELGITVGRHARTAQNPDDLSHDFPKTDLTLEDLGAEFDAAIGDLESFGRKALGHFPNWLATWPKAVRTRFAYILRTVILDNAASGTQVPVELKFLMMHVAAVAKGHAALSVSHAATAHFLAADKAQSALRLANAYKASEPNAAEKEYDGVFSPAEIAALRLARMSTNVPLTTPANIVDDLRRGWTEREMLELIIACAIASSIQRVAAVMAPDLDAEAVKTCNSLSLPIDVNDLKYPALTPALAAG